MNTLACRMSSWMRWEPCRNTNSHKSLYSHKSVDTGWSSNSPPSCQNHLNNMADLRGLKQAPVQFWGRASESLWTLLLLWLVSFACIDDSGTIFSLALASGWSSVRVVLFLVLTNSVDIWTVSPTRRFAVWWREPAVFFSWGRHWILLCWVLELVVTHRSLRSLRPSQDVVENLIERKRVKAFDESR